MRPIEEEYSDPSLPKDWQPGPELPETAEPPSPLRLFMLAPLVAFVPLNELAPAAEADWLPAEPLLATAYW